MSAPEELFTETFKICISRFAMVSSFREISRLGFPSATLHVYDKYLQFADELFNDPQHRNLFIDNGKAYEMLGGVKGFGVKMAQDQLSNYMASVDAASLVFAHSIIDSAALSYCRCCALTNHNDWEKFIEKKQISVGDVKTSTIDEIIKNKVLQYIDSLDRESLLFKVDRLFQVCQPHTGFSPLHNYVYDRERLRQLDEMRHEIVHKSTSVPKLPSGDDDIWFLQQTANFFMALVNEKYELKINPYHVVKEELGTLP